MKKYLVIFNDVVIDSVLWDGETPFAYPFQYTHLLEHDGFAGIGWSYINGEMMTPSYDEE